jgi:ABC-2 type transport system ATP-binding protein
MNNTDAIVVNNLFKQYKGEPLLAVDNASFQVSKGELFGLIGPDGAGKTSIFRMLTTGILPDKGSATVDGFDIVKECEQIRKIVGYMPGKFSLYQDMSIKENLDLFAIIFGTSLAKNYPLIEDIYIQIEPFKNRRAGKLSGGMKQKLALCCVLIHKPTILFLDEPTTGVDPVSRKELWEMLKRLKAQGMTIMVSTPYMDEAAMCDRIALIQNGKILSINTPENMIQEYPEQLYAIKAAQMYDLIKALRKYPEIMDCYVYGEYVHVTFKVAVEDRQLRTYLEAAGLNQVEIKRTVPTIEDYFIKLLKS